MSSFLDLQNEVLEHQLNDTKYRPSVKRWLNEAQGRIARQCDVPELYSATEFPWAAGFNHTSLPDDFARKVEVADSTDDSRWRLLAPMELSDFDALADAEGQAVDYVITGNLLYLYPTPNTEATIVLSYQRLPEEMVDDSDIPEIPADYHYLLCYWALYRAFARENDIEQSTAWKNDWVGELEKMKGELHYRGQDAPRQLQGTFDDQLPYFGDQWY